MTQEEEPTESEGYPPFSISLKCPYCNSDTGIGYGFAGGGYGPYTSCLRCGEIVSKSDDPSEED